MICRSLRSWCWTMLLVVACGSDRATTVATPEPGDAGDAPARGSPPPLLEGGAPTSREPNTAPAVETGDVCVLSADCRAAQFCDLGECIQECSAERPCGAGERCSARGRCLAPSEEDEDPPPTTKRLGTLSVSPFSGPITENDRAVTITLKSDSPEPVRYRVQVDAPYLGIARTRGTFVGETTLELFRSDALSDVEGSSVVRIFTTLGDAAVSTPVRTGITSLYEGAMTYRAGSVPLGAATVKLALREGGGEVAARIDGSTSLLFPSPESTPVTGRGTYRRSTGVQFVVEHEVPEKLGGERNHFARRIVRNVSFRLRPDAQGNLGGTFEERIEGLLTRTVLLDGSVTLRLVGPATEAAFEAPLVQTKPPEIPGTVLPLGKAFPGWSRAHCKSIVDPPTERGALCTPGNLAGDCGASLHYYASVADAYYYRIGQDHAPIGDLAEVCAREVTAGPDGASVRACADIPRLACALSDVALSAARDAMVSEVFAQLFAHVLDPAILVAQDEVVRGMKASFVGGPRAHLGALSEASKVLRGPATWILQPHVLEYLARIVSFGAPPERSGSTAHVVALRKLGRLFFLQSTIDGELARGRILEPASRADKLVQAQEAGLLTLLEAAAIGGILERWGQSAAPDLATELTDVLSSMDQGFRSLLDGEMVFGIREGFVPFLQERGNQETNFVQVLASVQSRLQQFEADEKVFVEAERTYENNDHEFARELLRVQTELETAIAGICGEEFDVGAVAKDEDWAKCGESWGGEAGEARLAIEQARSRLAASHERIHGIARRIEIRERAVQEIKEIRDGTIAFVDRNGKAVVQTHIREGVINAAQKFLELSAESGLTNFGAPLANAAVAAMLEAQRTLVQVDRTKLETAKEMRIRGDDALVEQKQGLAEIQTMYVDLNQLAVEMRQDVIGLLQSQITASNAVARARRFHSDRTKTLAHIARSPFLDPSFRLLADRASLQAVRSRFAAQQGLYIAGRALEYELNQPLGEAVSRAVFNAFNAEEASRLNRCLESIGGGAHLAKGQPQPYVTELSLRRVLGVVGERRDAVTGEVLTPADQFRRILLQNANLDGTGGAGVAFASSALQGNGLWPVNVCDDKIAAVSVQLVGDFLGDDDAQVELTLEEGGVLRRCDVDELVNWTTSGRSVIQAGVNSFGAAAANRSLQGLSVASSRFRLNIPGREIAPANADLDLRKVEDVVLRVEHEARPRGEDRTPISLECLSRIGAVR